MLFTEGTDIKIGIIGMAKELELIGITLEENTEEFRDKVFEYLSIIPNMRHEHDLIGVIKIAIDMIENDPGTGGEIVFVDGTLFRPRPTLAYSIEPLIIGKIQIHRIVIGQGRLGSYDWLHELCSKTAGREFISLTSRKISNNPNSIYDPVSYFVNLHTPTINVLLTGWDVGFVIFGYLPGSTIRIENTTQVRALSEQNALSGHIFPNQ